MADTAQATEEKTEATQDTQEDSKTQAQSVEFSEAVDAESIGPGGSINILLDMNIPVSAVIGKTQTSVRRLLQLGPGSVVKIDKPIDAPIDLYIKDTKFAVGNVVAVDGRFAVKIKQIIGLGEPAEKEETEQQQNAE